MYDLHGMDCSFVHRRILGGVTGFFSGGLTGAARGFVEGGAGSKAGLPIQRSFRRPPVAKFAGIPIPSAIPCVLPFRRDPITQECKLFIGGQPGPEPGGVGGGQAVLGRFGAALVPDVRDVMALRCLPGMVLGKMEADGGHLCYNVKDLTNKERKWPRGRRPLGTPAELGALAKAASFGRRMESTVKRMQKIGVLKKPASRRPAPRHRQLTAGAESTRIINVD